ncbi:hypothetical protein [Streptomyces sp. NBC_00140]|uniref:hypothetical protein n=1 Tax=Streptomyces sp. NBC_00140 TaxID=2975664 RepID=UPI00224DF528|nr:hypothetical protein [Streptomyces sp. NBC_00140]MCX5328573.1 hypothetical protein [Streptomyces sp. NBC_00140]
MIGVGIMLSQLGGEYGLAGSAPPDKRSPLLLCARCAAPDWTLHVAAAATGHAQHGRARQVSVLDLLVENPSTRGFHPPVGQLPN